MFKATVGYTSKSKEREIIKPSVGTPTIQQVLSKENIFTAQKLVKQIYVDEKITEYIVNIVFATRMPESCGLKDIASFIQYGASPRATLALYNASKAHAFLQQRHFVTPDDIKAVAPAILRHRILLTYEAEAEEITTDQIIHKILASVPSP